MREAMAQGYHEPRDALARNWGEFLAIALPEAAWLPVPNLGPERSCGFCEQWGINGLILTGGEDVGAAPARDGTERALLRYALHRDLPVLGVCRGLQLIWLEFGGELEHSIGHRAVRHGVRYVPDPELSLEQEWDAVNSYHNQVLRPPSRALTERWSAFAYAEDETIEGVRFRQGRIVGLMWHPEREQVPSSIDRTLVRRLFGLEGNNCRQK
jgi:gamma-glutamyl-gamma-aminobutyrate hydrolase PuuD